MEGPGIYIGMILFYVLLYIIVFCFIILCITSCFSVELEAATHAQPSTVSTQLPNNVSIVLHVSTYNVQRCQVSRVFPGQSHENA